MLDASVLAFVVKDDSPNTGEVRGPRWSLHGYCGPIVAYAIGVTKWLLKYRWTRPRSLNQ